jgi:hypothetical protein
MVQRTIAFFIFFIVASAGVSQTMFGHSNTGCIEFLELDKKNGTDPAIYNWIFGYFSGRIRETGRELQIINDLNIPLYDLLHKTCMGDPNINLQQAADIVYAAIP